MLELIDLQYLPIARWDGKQGFESCLHGNEMGVNQFALLCHNISCINYGHMEKDKGYFIPKYNTVKERMLSHITNTSSREVKEFTCNGRNDEEAIRKVEEGIRRSKPMIFRGCANAMPSLQRWTSSNAREYLMSKDPNEFKYLFGGEEGVGGLFPLPESLYDAFVGHLPCWKVKVYRFC